MDCASHKGNNLASRHKSKSHSHVSIVFEALFEVLDAIIIAVSLTCVSVRVGARVYHTTMNCNPTEVLELLLNASNN